VRDGTLVRVGRGPTATRLHVQREGTGEPLLWITGFAISSEIFSPVIDTYSAEFDCVRYDNRGAGRSPAPWRITSIPELAGDAVRLLDALGIDSAHVYGLSMGGMVAQEVAIRFPDRVRGLVLGCTTHGGPRAVLPSPKVAAALTARGAPVELRAQLVGRALFSEDFRSREPELVRRYLGLLNTHRTSARGAMSHLAASTYHDTRARLGRIVAPTLVLHGDRDVLTPPANARLLADAIPGATLGMVRGAGHAYLLEQPQESHRLFLDWLRPRTPLQPGRPLTGLAARSEPLTRHLGLQVGMLRTARSLTAQARTRAPR
jgi:pimeloyl-ACP methyl ester carboxylesterase